ncbi:hypothetical protein MMC31_000886 [Peltigera leucophlebia]|nr:hypothetical protein [Peltigera leucophlebia]
MSVPRLSFLYPQFFKAVKSCEFQLPRATPRFKKPPRNSAFCTSALKAEEAYPQRYGAAAEPQKPPPGAAESPGVTTTLANAIETEVKAQNEKKNEAKSESTRTSRLAGGSQVMKKPPESSLESQTLSVDNMPLPSKLDGNDVHPRDPVIPPTIKTSHGDSLDTVLHMGNSRKDVQNHKHLHMHPSPHVHHFDTFKLVRDLENGGFSEQQSVRLMKAVRSLLAMNLKVANESLVSKSDVENETYLFRAACSELRTEFMNIRKASNSKMATQRAHLQHEVDILSQKATQDSLALKDDFRGMLNDRKMAVRMQQQARDSKIQELNQKITVELNSNSKSEVEGLRWVLTRRAVMAIASMAILILGSLRYSSYQTQQQEKRLKLLEASSPSSTGSPSHKSGGEGKNFVTLREAAAQTGDEGNAVHGNLEADVVSLG